MTTKASFDARTPCRRIWDDLMDDGKLSSSSGTIRVLVVILDCFFFFTATHESFLVNTVKKMLFLVL